MAFVAPRSDGPCVRHAFGGTAVGVRGRPGWDAIGPAAGEPGQGLRPLSGSGMR